MATFPLLNTVAILLSHLLQDLRLFQNLSRMFSRWSYCGCLILVQVHLQLWPPLAVPQTKRITNTNFWEWFQCMKVITNLLQFASYNHIAFAYHFTLTNAVYFIYIWLTFVAGKIGCIAYQLRWSHDIVYYSCFIALTNFWNQIHCMPLLVYAHGHRQHDMVQTQKWINCCTQCTIDLLHVVCKVKPGTRYSTEWNRIILTGKPMYTEGPFVYILLVLSFE